MNTISRGIRNAFRNWIRTLSIVIILGLSIGLSLTMLLAHQAVQQKISSVKSSIGNTINIAPAGFSAFSSANNSLTTNQLSKVGSLPHVTNVTETLTDRLTTIGSSQPSFGGFGGQSANSNSGQTNLTSPTKINIDKSRSGSGGGFFVNGGGTLPTNFTLPITIVGTNNPTSVNSTNLTLSSGSTISSTANNNETLISSAMASKNNLKVGSTFTAYSKTLTVTGIFTSSNDALNDSIIVSLPTEQSLSGQSGDVTSAVVTVDSLDNLSSVTTAIKSQLGSSADITNAQDQANAAIAPLNSVKTISLFSLIGAVVAGAIIILLVMIMIVRERRREIGVLKAIGGSNLRIMLQFVSEAVTLTVLGAIIGLIIGVIGGTPVTKLLVNNSNSTPSTSQTNSGQAGRFGGGFAGGGQTGAGNGTTPATSGAGFSARLRNNSVINSASSIHAAVGWSILLYGFGAAILIAILGSTLAAGLIAKVRPAEVMRAE